MIKHYLPIVLFFLSTFSIFSQTVQGRKYATQQYMNNIRATDTIFQIKNSALERYTLDFKQYGSMDTVVVPVVFHIVYSGQTPPISVADVEAQVAQLNVDFYTPGNPYTSNESYKISGNNEGLVYLHPADRYEGYAARAGLPMIKFCFPQFDPQNNSTNGVLFVSSAVPNWGINDSLKRSDLGGSTPWDAQKYCNIWVTSLSGGIAGYAQMPGASSLTDGIVIDQRYFIRADGTVSLDAGGNDFALGRTLVHLMGSYLNLYELWNEATPCADDYVEDTPIHNAPNYGKDDYRHVTTCDGNAVEMSMNLMDSGCDSTMYMFTWGQVARMQSTLSTGGPRGSLTQTLTSCNVHHLVMNPEDRSENNSERKAALQVRAVPNPNSGDFTVEIQTNEASDAMILVQVFNSSGSLMLEKTITQIAFSASRLPVSGYGWPSGIYTVRVSTVKEIQIKQVIINH